MDEGDRAALDAAAARRVAAGDAEALRELYERYSRIVHSFAFRITGDAGLAEECTQDVFVTLWKRADRYDPERARLTTWLFVVARNRAIELVRARARRATPEADVDVPGSAPDAAELVAAADTAQRVAEAMAELPEAQLEVVRLSFFDGLSHAEIAELIGVPLGTVKGRMRLALERLRALADEYQLQVEHG